MQDEPLTILIADDDPLFRCLLENRLRTWGYRILLAQDGDKAWEILSNSDKVPDLIILDWVMPGVDGLELCRRVRGLQRQHYQYILLISGKDDKQDVIEGLDAGADDYLTKPLDIGELQARLRTGKRILSLQQELIQAREELRYQATHDALTGLWSRGAALNLLNTELQRGSRTDSMTGLLMIDVDHFKAVNDQYGHLMGDTVLKEIAIRIDQTVRSYDFVGRYGGEEFVAILSNCSPTDLQTIALRTCEAVKAMPVMANSTTIRITVSIGGVVARNGTSELDLLSAADSALYDAKRLGRDRVVIGTCGRDRSNSAMASAAGQVVG